MLCCMYFAYNWFMGLSYREVFDIFWYLFEKAIPIIVFFVNF